MSAGVIAALGGFARVMRAGGLARPLALGRDAADALCAAAGRPPLRAAAGVAVLRGYLRHRSFLASLVEQPYEPLLRRLFEHHVTPGAVVVDGGAHIGLYALLAARRGAAAVLAFEPDPHNHRALAFNLRGAAGARPLRAALGAAPGQATFHASGGTIGGSLVARAEVGPTRPIAVARTTLDAALGGLPLGRLVVKLDLEGGEIAALAGGRESILRAGSVALFAEVNPPALAAAGATPGELLAAIGGLGLRAHLIDEGGRRLVPADSLPRLSKGNLIAVRGVAP